MITKPLTYTQSGTYTEFRRCVNELELDLFQILARRMCHEWLAYGYHTLPCSRYRTLQHQEIVLDYTIVGETTHRRDFFLGDIMLGRGIGFVFTRSNSVNLFVEFRAVVISVYEMRRPLSTLL
jgi:hypothetical protein